MGHRPAVLAVRETAFPDARACLSAKQAAVADASNQFRTKDHAFNNAIVAAATPNHFRHLISLQGSWSRGTNGRIAKFAQVVSAVQTMMKDHRRGIYACFRGGELVLFQPFSGVDYSNRRIRSSTQGVTRVFKSRPGRIHPRPEQWYVNHCWVDPGRRRQRTPTEWWTTEYLYFFRSLSGVEDVDVLINNSDFPIASKAGPAGLLPVLGAVTHPDYRDVPIPTLDDIELVYQRVFLHMASVSTCRDIYLHPFRKIAWSRKKPAGVFRGSMTGCGTTAASNPRARLAQVSQKHPDLLDAGLTSFDEWMPRYDPETRSVRLVDPERVGSKLADPIPLHEQSSFKYLINVEGYVGAFRYLFLLSSGSVVINVKSRWTMWYEPMIRSGVHVVEVPTVDDVIPAIRWCRENDGKCREIARAAKKLHGELASVEAITEYMTRVFRKIHEDQKDR